MDEYFKKIEPGQKLECIFPENSLTGTLKIGDSVFSVYLGFKIERVNSVNK